ncbi:MAG: flagellar biosynthesis anti-sigma factor FlgM [Myxococcales bacterium]|jgi:flagellar biosynthesis anti-sigma factor FlgM
MRIENKQVLGGYTRTSKSAPAGGTQARTEGIGKNTSAGVAAEASFSDAGKELSRAKAAGASQLSTVDTAKVTRLRSEVSEGRFQVNPGMVAQRMVDAMAA